MATDRSSMKYEIFIVNTANVNDAAVNVGMYVYTLVETLERESILVYENKMGRWRTTTPY